jgi:hypothetical protein
VWDGWSSGAQFGQSLFAGTDFAHSVAGAEDRSAGLIIKRLMIKSQPLQYPSHGDWTSARMSIADLDCDAAAIGKAGGVDRFRARLGDQSRDCPVQVELVTPRT